MRLPFSFLRSWILFRACHCPAWSGCCFFEVVFLVGLLICLCFVDLLGRPAAFREALLLFFRSASSLLVVCACRFLAQLDFSGPVTGLLGRPAAFCKWDLFEGLLVCLLCARLPVFVTQLDFAPCCRRPAWSGSSSRASNLLVACACCFLRSADFVQDLSLACLAGLLIFAKWDIFCRASSLLIVRGCCSLCATVLVQGLSLACLVGLLLFVKCYFRLGFYFVFFGVWLPFRACHCSAWLRSWIFSGPVTGLLGWPTAFREMRFLVELVTTSSNKENIPSK